MGFLANFPLGWGVVFFLSPLAVLDKKKRIKVPDAPNQGSMMNQGQIMSPGANLGPGALLTRKGCFKVKPPLIHVATN